MAGEKTEKATPKRREDARKKGQVARRPELPSAVRFLAALIVLRVTGVDAISLAQRLFVESFSQTFAAGELSVETAHNLFISAVGRLCLLALPVVGVAAVAGVVSNFAQGGLTLSTDALIPKAERFNPASNLKRIFSPNSLVDLLKNILKLVGLGISAYGILIAAVTNAPTLINSSPAATMAATGELAYSIGMRTGLVLLVVAAMDYGYGWFKHEKSLKMSKQEIKDEYRDQEGDPHVKGQRRRAARALSQRRMMADVVRADVIITNPTHFAVALAYDREKSAAPVVLAKGADLMALRIRKVAEENNIAIVENPPLARALFRSVELGRAIPAELFRSVAEVLAFVYRQRERTET